MSWVRRLLTVALLVAASVVLSPGQAAFAMCEGDPPIPARPDPYEPRITGEGDPFSGNASIQSHYGYSPHVWNYDNGCSPGSDIMPGVGTALANIGFDAGGALAGWTHALLEAVISPTWAAALDRPVTAATEAVANGTWTPWVTAVLLMVGVVVLFRSRSGHMGGAITAAVWALLVLVVVSWLVNYPTESVRAVDGTIRSAVVKIGDGFTGGTSTGATQEERALDSVDGQMDSIVRTVEYRAWAKAVFGDPDSQTAREYGPDVFRATHFTWQEWETYKSDPAGEGAEIREQKQEEFEELAGEIEDADPAAYEYFTGSDWGSRITQGGLTVLVMAVVCAFLLVAGLTVLAAFVVIRLLVPFAPALGVLFLLDVARDRAIDVFRRVGGVLVMGPVYFVASLVLLRFYGGVLSSSMPFVLQLTFVIALSVVAWQLLKPASAAVRPGVSAARRQVRRHLPQRGKSGNRAVDQPSGGQGAPESPQDGQGRPSSQQPGVRQQPVYSEQNGPTSGVPHDPATPGTFLARDHPGVVTVEAPDQPDEPVAQPAGAPYRSPRAPRVGTQETAPPQRAPEHDGNPSHPSTVYTAADEPGPRIPAQPTPSQAERPATFKPAAPSGSHHVNESNLTYNEDGNQVFVVYTPADGGR